MKDNTCVLKADCDSQSGQFIRFYTTTDTTDNNILKCKECDISCAKCKDDGKNCLNITDQSTACSVKNVDDANSVDYYYLDTNQSCITKASCDAIQGRFRETVIDKNICNKCSANCIKC